MHRLLPAIGTLALLLAACDRAEDPGTTAPAKTTRGDAAGSLTPTNPSPAPPRDSIDLAEATRTAETLADRIYQLSDDDMTDLLEAVVTKDDPELRRSLLTTIYEETTLRPPVIRLPLLLEVARHKDVAPDLRTTIMAELGATLNTDHGSSWADWSLALEEHLADKHGLIRVE